MLEERLEVYECVNCLRPAFTAYCGKAVAGEFAAEDGFLVFGMCFRVVLSPECFSFNGITLCLVSCRCDQELGYFLPYYRRAALSLKNFIARVGRVKARDDAELVRLTEYVENEAIDSMSMFRKNQEMEKRHILSAAGNRVKAYVDEVVSVKRQRRDDEDEYRWLVDDFVVEEILPRLPGRSLCKFKAVCKGWRHCITSDSSFISNQLRHSQNTRRLSIIMVNEYPRHRMLFVDDKAEIMDVGITEKRCVGRYFTSYLVGSCNGLVCLMLRDKLYRVRPLLNINYPKQAIMLWNPETGQARDAHLPHLVTPSRYVGDFPVFGFGFDQSHDDYKVVRVSNISVASPLGLSFEVFSRNTGCWRVLEKVLPGCKLTQDSFKSVLLHTRLYWLVILANVSPPRLCVLWFDLNDDEFGVMDVLGVPYRRNFQFLVKWERDSLAFLDRYGGNAHRVQFIVGPTTTNTSHLLKSLELKRWNLCGVSQDRFFVNDRDIL